MVSPRLSFHTCIHQVAEELPAGRRLEEGQLEGRGDTVQGSAGGHGARNTLGGGVGRGIQRTEIGNTETREYSETYCVHHDLYA